MRPRRARSSSFVVALATALVLTACSSGAVDNTSDTDVDPAPTVAAVASTEPCPDVEHVPPRADGLPDLELPCLGDGPAVRLSDLRGVPMVLNVWAAWCTNCEREMPLFADAAARAGSDLRFLGVHYKATREQGLQSVDDFGVPFPSVFDEDGDLVVKELGAYAPPQTFFVTADGRVAGREIGEITSQDELDRLIARYLGVDL